MSIRSLLRSPRARRGIAAGAIILSLGGLTLFRSDAGATTSTYTEVDLANGTPFSGPGAHGTFALSHSKVLANGQQRIFAELRIKADQVADADVQRAPLSIAIVLDTSGSMDGNKMLEAKTAVIKLLSQMRDDDEVALIRYDSRAQTVQHMARVGNIRHHLSSVINRMESGGGTNIPSALRLGMNALRSASDGRVQRLVLVSDGLDSTRTEAESLARTGTDTGVTVSALGIGLDFDEGYMAGVARAGRGNFGFVQDASTLDRFLEVELNETANTVVERVTARIQLPRHVSFVRAIGADARALGDGEVLLRLGSLFGGDERRVVLELRSDAPLSIALDVASDVSWNEVGGEHTAVELKPLSLVATASPQEVERTRDNRVWASCMSAFASVRQIDAAAAYARGDVAEANRIMLDNMRDLDSAAEAAPEQIGEGLRAQSDEYRDAQRKFKGAAPSSAEGRAAAKAVTERDTKNLARPTWEDSP